MGNRSSVALVAVIAALVSLRAAPANAVGDLDLLADKVVELLEFTEGVSA